MGLDVEWYVDQARSDAIGAAERMVEKLRQEIGETIAEQARTIMDLQNRVTELERERESDA